jgi:OmpA-OmpF porin, OOP family
MFGDMRRVRIWWVVFALVALVGLGAVTVHRRTGGLWLPGSTDRETRAPDTVPQGGRDKAPDETPRPPQEHIAFRATRDGERIIVSGFILRDETRNSLVEEAKQAVPNTAVSDEMKRSDKVSPRLDEAAVFAVRQLARLSSATVTVSDDTISITGQAPDIDTYTATAATRPLPEGFRLDIAGLIPPVVRPYTWSATSGEDGIALAGYSPSEAARQAVDAAARAAFPDKSVNEGLQPASGLPKHIDFDAAVRFALTQLAQLRSGTAELVDAKLNFRGDVTDRETLASVRAALQTGLPPGLQAGSVAITLSKPSPYTFRARRDAGTLTLTGYYPDVETRTAINQLIRERFLTEPIVDRLRAADGAPRNYLAGVSFGLEHLSRLASGEVVVNDTSLQINGEALYPQTVEQTTRMVPALPLRGWTAKAEVRLRPPENADAAQLRSPRP